ncbi:MAG TPA: hypothetical protein VE934_09335 [Polaromonas sp.]|nr:hypothetical protein [Polaromonas sp.]
MPMDAGPRDGRWRFPDRPPAVWEQGVGWKWAAALLRLIRAG